MNKECNLFMWTKGSLEHTYTRQWRSNVPKSGGAHRHVIFVPSVKNQYKRVVFGCMVI